MNGGGTGLVVGDSIVTSLPISLDIVVDIQGINVVEEGSIFQAGRQVSVAGKVAMNSHVKGGDVTAARRQPY